jgi:hypothetical protein
LARTSASLGAFGIVVGAAARQHQVGVLATTQVTEGLDHPQWILDAIEARHLSDQRLARREPVG